MSKKLVVCLYMITIYSFFTTNSLYVNGEDIESTSSKATLSIKKGANDLPPKIIIPNSNDKGITNQIGDLTLDYLPTFEFSLAKKTISDGYYNLVLDDLQESFVQVSDRSGTGNGWKLDLSIEPFIGEKAGLLTQGTITFHNVDFFTSEKNVSTAPNFKNEVVFPIGKETVQKTLIEAGKYEGMHSWAAQFRNSKQGKITMQVPFKGVITDKYTSTFLWQLSTAPND